MRTQGEDLLLCPTRVAEPSDLAIFNLFRACDDPSQPFAFNGRCYPVVVCSHGVFVHRRREIVLLSEMPQNDFRKSRTVDQNNSCLRCKLDALRREVIDR
jgi:hypothetical protein